MAFFNNHKPDVCDEAAQTLAERLLEVVARLNDVVQSLNTVGELAERSVRHIFAYTGRTCPLTLDRGLRTFLCLNTCFEVGLFSLGDVRASQRNFDALTYLSTTKRWISLHL